MMKRVFVLLVCVFCVVSSKGQFLADSEIFPGWTNRNTGRSNMKGLVALKVSLGESHWNYREKPLKWSGALDLDLFQKINIGMGIIGENDYWVSAGTKLFGSEGLEIESGIQRFRFSSFNQFSNNLYVNTKITVREPFFLLLESSYSYNSNNELMKSPWLLSARLGLKIDLNDSGFGGFSF